MMRRMRLLVALVAVTVTVLGAAPQQTFRTGVSLVRVPVVVTSKDCANAVTRHVADAALQMMLAARQGKPLPPLTMTQPVADAGAK